MRIKNRRPPTIQINKISEKILALSPFSSKNIIGELVGEIVGEFGKEQDDLHMKF